MPQGTIIILSLRNQKERYNYWSFESKEEIAEVLNSNTYQTKFTLFFENNRIAISYWVASQTVTYWEVGVKRSTCMWKGVETVIDRLGFYL